MRVLVVGDGVLGSALVQKIPGAKGTSRKGEIHFDLRDESISLPECDVAYLTAGTKGYRECEGDTEIFRADVDGNIRLAKHLHKSGVFVVFISTDGVEWGAHTSYARNRLLVEMFIHSIDGAIVRPAKFDASNVDGLCELLTEIGAKRKGGVHYWPRSRTMA